MHPGTQPTNIRHGMTLPVTETTLKSDPPAKEANVANWRRMADGRFIWLIRPDIPQKATVAIVEGVRHPADFIRQPSRRSESAVFRLSNFVAKRYFARKVRDRVKAIIRGAHAKQVLDWVTTVTSIGVTTISPAAIAYARWGPWESYLVSDYIPERCTIHEHVEPLHSSLQRRWIINALADTMARLHNAGVSHGDAHLANFIVERVAPPRLLLVDLDALRWRTMSGSAAARDLKRLLDYAPGSQTEHLRFLVTYARCRQPRIRARELLRHLQAWRRGPGPLRHAP